MCSKPLIELLGKIGCNATDAHDGVAITSITQDSRAVVVGSLFVAIKGHEHNGEDFIDAAIKNGAAAILVSEDYALYEMDNSPLAGESKCLSILGGEKNINSPHAFTPHALADAPAPPPQGGSNPSYHVVFVAHQNPRLALSLLAEAFYQPQPLHKIAITGTDGKTSTAEFTRQLWELCACTAISVGTLGLKCAHPLANLPALSDNTSPEPASFYAALSECAKQGVQHAVVEASSIGIEQHRLAGFAPNIAIFTSFSQDHLDYHATMAEYFAAKAELFLQNNPTCILCADYAEIATLAATLTAQGKSVITYGTTAQADLRINAITSCAQGQQVDFSYQGTEFCLNAPLYGDFQAYNLLAASLAVSQDLQLPLQHILQYWGQVQPIKGRLQLAGESTQGALIFVDYAHTAGALQKALQTLRPYAQGKLHVLFGCGGNRDAGKRPQMGAVAHNFANIITVTDDNPRGENAATIRASIIAACPQATEIACRAQAIAHAVAQLQSGDVLLIAGKGHEDYQIIGTTKHPFDDVLEVQKNL